MSRPSGPERLEIETDPEYQRGIWRWQRLAWAVMGATILAALLGAFGDGPLFRGRATDPGGLIRIDYDYFGRRENEQDLSVEVRPTEEGTILLWVDREYVEAAAVRSIRPTPWRESASADGIWYEFSSAGADQPVRISMRLNPSAAGMLRGKIRLGNGPILSFRQWIHP